MEPLDYAPPPPTPGNRIWLARGVAVAADVLQVALLPVTAEGAFSPVDDAIDVATAVVLTSLVGWHIAFVPSFLVKLMPIADLAPTWTVAVLIATAGRSGAALPLAPVPMLPAGDPGGRRSGNAARVRAAVWFAVVFAIAFAVSKAYLMPHLPPVNAGWRQNWAGAVVGGVLGLLAARTVLRRAGRNGLADV